MEGMTGASQEAIGTRKTDRFLTTGVQLSF
jgi:hypothetical protein